MGDCWKDWPERTMGPPVDPDTLVDIRFLAGKVSLNNRAGSLDWSHSGKHRIVAYRANPLSKEKRG